MTTSSSTLPLALDELANQWRDYIKKNITITTTSDMTKHVDGTASTYHIQFTFVSKNGEKTLHYAGMTRKPKTRLSLHKSELRTCKATTRIGKSKLYCSEYFDQVHEIKIFFSIHDSGFLTDHDVKHAERKLSDELQTLHGAEAVLTRPRKKSQ